ncbi:MAG: alpha/beta fold hydrolase [bacterium]|nr:alpha/beta fold hydrolase [bacterium]
MSSGYKAPATLPPSGLAGLDPAWSRIVSAPDSAGVDRTWHVLDNGVADADLTFLCVHGNPTWSYLWRNVLAAAPPGVRAIAIDHLDMGFSERTGTFRRLDQRIADLESVVEALEIDSPIVTVAQDWGGPISVGWAGRNRGRLAGIVLMNTAVHQPAGSPAPTLIRLARSRVVLNTLATRTKGFLTGTLRLARPRLTKAVRAGFMAPYRSPARRKAIAEFVADIPLEPDHPSTPALDEVVAAVEAMADVPVLLLWGSKDPVFSDLYLRDLSLRWPAASVHRYGSAGHLTPEDVEIAEPIFAWASTLDSVEAKDVATGGQPLWSAIEQRRDSPAAALVEMEGPVAARSFSWADLATDVERVGAGLAAAGVRRGDRVSLLVPPGIDLTVCLYACWRIGAVAVIADAGLGATGMTRALRSAAPMYLVGVSKAIAAARTLRWPGKKISVEDLSSTRQRVLGVWKSLDEIRNLGRHADVPAVPADADTAVVVFTSGATGPAKGVVYRHRQAQAQRDALIDLYGITDSDRLVAAFAPFALYGAAIGIPSVVPDMEVTAPGTLTARALAGAVMAIDATMVFASPAALVNVVKTSDELAPTERASLLGVRLLMSAGAPVPAELLRQVSSLVPNAELHTPYGMTEVLPVADIELDEIERAGQGEGVCVGFPINGAEVAISPLDEDGDATGSLITDPAVRGEICIRAAHARNHYDKLWATTQAASQPAGWHRSGDVGHLDDAGRLWVEGRMIHIIRTATGVVTPVGIEHAAESVEGVTQAAAVGVGPAGTQQVVVAAVTDSPKRSAGLADLELADAVRNALKVDVAAVLEVPELPVDKRHNSKINRTRVAEWAERVLAGGKVGTP